MPDSFVLEVVDKVEETGDACSAVLGVPPDLRDRFSYRPGQFLTIAIPSDEAEGGAAARSYSLSSSPHEGLGTLRFTVKRTPGGFGSRWVCDALGVGDPVRVLPPDGVFCPEDLDGDLLLLSAGSGVTPSMSILGEALAVGRGQVTLVYANADADAVIFADRLAVLEQQHPDRFRVIHWLESERGLPHRAGLAKRIAPYAAEAEAFVCGPLPFMAEATGALRQLGVPRERRHQERFSSLGGNPFGHVGAAEGSPRL